MKTKMKELHLKRLKKLANHLLHGKLGHKRFDFACLNVINIGDEFKVNGCGTIGCGLGECPIIFKKWIFDNLDNPILEGCWSTSDSAMTFFNINNEQDNHLFYPNAQKPRLYGGKKLNSDATKEEVANNMLEFIKLKRNETKS